MSNSDRLSFVFRYMGIGGCMEDHSDDFEYFAGFDCTFDSYKGSKVYAYLFSGENASTRKASTEADLYGS